MMFITERNEVMVMMNTTMNVAPPTTAELLHRYFDEVFGKPLPQNEDTAALMAGVIAAMYGPALKELEKH